LRRGGGKIIQIDRLGRHQMVDAVDVAQTARQFRDFLSVGDESVSLTRNGDNVVGIIRTLTERPPKGRHLAREIVLLDRCVRPDAIQQLVLCDETIATFEQDGEHVEGLRGDRYGVTLAP
jgi:hypothetical protein